jgi:hypothetical protein
MKVLKYVMLTWPILALLSCGKEKIEHYQLDSIFRAIKLNKADSANVEEFNICEYIPSAWDSIVIVNPYTVMSRMDALNLSNFSSIESEIENVILQDNKCSLLFVKRNKVIGYGTVQLRPIDFSGFPAPQILDMPTIKRSDCRKLYLKRGQYETDIYYEVMIRQ